MSVTNRTELKDYALRALGHPLVEVDITPEAMDDRINEAIDFFREYYYDGTDRAFYKHIVTAADQDAGYIQLPDNIWAANTLFPVSNTTSATDIFSYEYQFRASDVMRNLHNTGLVYYQQVMSQLSLIENILNVGLQFRFNRNDGRLFVDTNWHTRLPVGIWLLVDCYAVMNPDVQPKFWNNRKFKDYVIALFKMQWSRAYSKYDSIQLPGGVTIDGKSMYAEAKAEVDDIEQDIIGNQSPLGFTMG